MKWQFKSSIIPTIIFALLIAFHIPTEPGGSPVNPADAYCDKSSAYESPYDGTPQYPIGCTIAP